MQPPPARPRTDLDRTVPLPFSVPLPIDDALDDLNRHLKEAGRAVLVAPPGAGKTSRVPLALLGADWVGGRQIVLLEPRRLAARAAAERMAESCGDKVGDTIGLRMRLESRTSAGTRILVVTEGVFARMILADPTLDGIAAVIFDEFHERSLDADLGLALTLDVRGALREDLRVLVMSATLDGARVADLMEGAPVVESRGRAHPVTTRYLGRDPRQRIEEAVLAATLTALAEEDGSLLVFLPGQREITNVAERLRERLVRPDVDVAPLYAALDGAGQRRAIAPAVPGRRKIVLTTSIAETSLTIDGVRVVIDSGLARVPRFEPDSGLTRLETRRASRAAVDQRRGRAGRTAPGVCYRLWDEAATGGLDAFTQPEILAADLSGLLLDLGAWGVRDPAHDLRWLDPPPRAALTEARKLLETLGACDGDGRLTDDGQAIRALALPPRLAAMVIRSARDGRGAAAAELATLLTERGLGGDEIDADARLARFRQDRSPRAEAARRLGARFAREVGATRSDAVDEGAGPLLASAFPDRIAKARGAPGQFLMAGGRAAELEPHHPLAREAYLAIGEVAGRASATRILLAAQLGEAAVIAQAGPDIVMHEEVRFEPARAALAARRQRRFGALVLSSQNLPVPADEASATVLVRGIASAGLPLPWSRGALQWRDRVVFLRRQEPDAWPDLSDSALGASPDLWLAPFVVGRASLAAITEADVETALAALLPFELARRLDTAAPTHFTTPAGSRLPLAYDDPTSPKLSVRVQELFGLGTHPTLGRSNVPLSLELLSPAHRPIQVTRDLPGFWRGSWAAVRSEMRGRYPRHPWPDDPAAAAPTTRAKPR